MDLTTLTPSQRRILSMLVLGDTNAQIGAAMVLSEKTIKAHVTSIFKKTGCVSRARLIANYYLEQQHGCNKKDTEPSGPS